MVKEALAPPIGNFGEQYAFEKRIFKFLNSIVSKKSFGSAALAKQIVWHERDVIYHSKRSKSIRDIYIFSGYASIYAYIKSSQNEMITNIWEIGNRKIIPAMFIDKLVSNGFVVEIRPRIKERSVVGYVFDYLKLIEDPSYSYMSIDITKSVLNSFVALTTQSAVTRKEVFKNPKFNENIYMRHLLMEILRFVPTVSSIAGDDEWVTCEYNRELVCNRLNISKNTLTSYESHLKNVGVIKNKKENSRYKSLHIDPALAMKFIDDIPIIFDESKTHYDDLRKIFLSKKHASK